MLSSKTYEWQGGGVSGNEGFPRQNSWMEPFANGAREGNRVKLDHTDIHAYIHTYLHRFLLYTILFIFMFIITDKDRLLPFR